MSSDGGETDNSNMEAFLRNWRQTAFNAGQFQTAIFVGDKLLALTSQSSYTMRSMTFGADLTRGLSRRRH